MQEVTGMKEKKREKRRELRSRATGKNSGNSKNWFVIQKIGLGEA